jgi:hypothetical protein
MATVDRRGVSVDSTDPPIAGDPNPGLAIKAPCLVATTASITLSGLQTIDGVAVAEGNRVLVWQQADPTTNGIYNASSGPWSRAIDARSNDQWAAGLLIEVSSGATYGRVLFAQTAPDPIVLGTTALGFAAASVPGFRKINTTAPLTGGGDLSADRTLALLANGITYGLIQKVAAAKLLGNPSGVLATASEVGLGATLGFSGSSLQTLAMSGDISSAANSFAATLATVNANVGSFGSATQAAQVTVNGKGLTTAVALVTMTPAIGSITGLGTGIATALAVNVGVAGAPVVNGGVLGSPSSVGTLPAYTLGGTVSGGGNQVNNVVIGTSTPLAGTFTTLTANTSVSSPIVKSAAAVQFQTNGTTFAGNVTTGQQWFLGTSNNAPPTGPTLTASKNTSALPALGTPVGVVGTAQIVSLLGGVDGSPADLAIQSFGGASSVRYFSAPGTAAARTATTNGLGIATNFAYGYTSTNVYVAAGGFLIGATENFTGTNSGTRVDIYATPTGTTGVAVGASVGAGLMVGTTADPGAGNLIATGALQPGSFTVATLPAGAAGKSVWCSNCRVFNGAGVQEGAAAGTGGFVTHNGTAWKIAGTNITAIA